MECCRRSLSHSNVLNAIIYVHQGGLSEARHFLPSDSPLTFEERLNMDMLLEFCITFWNVFAMMAPWLIIGFFIAGIMAVCLPRDFVMRFLGASGGIKSIIRAVMIGVPLPICSCGVIPISTALRNNGASKGSTAGFLISTPQTGIDSVLATYALMGPLFAVARPVAAFLTGLVGGCAVHALSDNDASPCTATQQSTPPPRNLRMILPPPQHRWQAPCAPPREWRHSYRGHRRPRSISRFCEILP